jgi:DNA-binding MarR family transcriptional regulator
MGRRSTQAFCLFAVASLRENIMKIEEEIRQQKFKSPYQKAVINLLFTANWLHNKQEEFFRTFGITAQQFNILRILKGQHPRGIPAKEIKQRMVDKNSDVSRLLDRLCSKALVERKICPLDKRASEIFITACGNELLDRLDPHQDDIDAILALTEEEAHHLSDLLDKARR